MNIVIVMSGGVGERFGSELPKQYCPILGMPIIDYVLEEVEKSELTDKIVVVIDPKYQKATPKLENSHFIFANNGKTRHQSVKNGLIVIKNNFRCDKVIIVDAIRPFITSELIDIYFRKLDEYDAIVTSEKIVGSLTNYNNSIIDREDYVITNSPIGFRFNILYENFNENINSQEVLCMLPKESKRCYYFDFHNNFKLTYPEDLEYFEFLLRKRRVKSSITI